MLGLSIKLFLFILLMIAPTQPQTTSVPYRIWPYPWAETGSLTLLLNGSTTGNRTYTLNFMNSYTSIPKQPIYGIKTFKSIILFIYQGARPSSFVDFFIYVSSINKTSAVFTIMIGAGYWIQYLQLNYVIDQLGAVATSYSYLSFYVTIFLFQDSANSSKFGDPNYAGNITRLIDVKADFFIRLIFNFTTLPASTNKLLYFLRTMRMTSTLGNLNQLKMYDPQYYDTLRLSLTMFKPLGVSFQLLSFIIIYYSMETDLGGNRDIFWGSMVTLPPEGGSFYTSNTWTTSFMITGLSFMQFISDSSVIDYQSTQSMSLISSVKVVPQNPYSSTNVSLKSTTTTYYHFYRYTCPTSGHVYNTVDAICYAVCPTGTIQKLQYGKCYACMYSCLTCTQRWWDAYYGAFSDCTSCRASDFRVLVAGQCVCNSSYFDDGYSSTCRTCSSVNNLTSTCSFTLDPIKPSSFYQQLFAGNWTTNVLPLYKSLSCLSGFILLNDLCSTCSQAMPYCDTCTNSTVCLTCNASATKYTDEKCYLCNLMNCVLCKQNNVCQTCGAGYIINGTVCIVEPCSTNCNCGGFYLPKVNGTCSTFCGDGFKVGTEECDDNNTIDRDGCSSSCKIQTCAQNCSCSGWHFPVVNNSCSTVCGDGFKVSLEECDDGNTINHDGCSSTCKIETCSQNCSCAGYAFPVLNDKCSTVCGDGVIAGAQECDDSNTISGDGCSSTCVKQNCSAICTCDGWGFPFVNGICSPICGDGLLRGGQQCDDGNVANYDGCSSNCKIEGCNVTCNCSGWAFPRVNGLCTTVCGDSILVGLEQCDDGNLVNGDGCSSACILEPCNESCTCGGYHLPRVNGLCTIICGDGIKKKQQQCDDGNTQSHDGCSSTCLIETLCNQSCSCDGWTQPFVNGSCSTICGDDLKRGKQECDDGSILNHDGCSSVCKVQTQCSQSCLCGGWAQPFINGSCSTVCGDGIVLGKEQCDDNNSQSEDGCTNCVFDPIFMKISQTQQFMFFSQQKTYYASLVLFCFGFRIIGMQMLWVIQSFQLLLSNSNTNMKISANIHGYSDPTDFPFKIPNVQVQLLDRFNYMFFLALGIFIVCTLLETLGQCCRSSNQITNSMGQESPLTFTKGPNGFRQRQYEFEEERDHGNEEFTVHYAKRSNYRNDILSESQALSIDMNELQTQTLPPTFFSRFSRTILRQFFFDLIMNVQPVIFSSLVSQVMANGLESVINFPTLITAGIMEMFFVGLMIFCWRGGEFFGENQSKFQENKFMRFWLVTSVQKVLTSAIIGSKMTYYLYMIGGLKLLVLIYFCADKLYYSKIQNYRCMIMNALHLLLYGGFIVQNVYLIPQNVSKLPMNFMQYTYTVLMGSVIGITAIFYFRELTSNCEANTRKAADDSQAVAHQRLFYSKKDINESAIRNESKINPTSSSIIEELKSKHFIPKNNTTSTVYGQKSKIYTKNKLPQPQYRPSQEYQDSYTPNLTQFNYKSKTQRRKQEENDQYERQSHFRENQDDLNNAKYARSTKGRSFAKNRRAGRKNENNNEQNLNKQNNPRSTRFEQQRDSYHHQNEQRGTKSAYRNRNQNSSKTKGQNYRKAQTQKHVKSIKNIRDSQQRENDFDYYNPVSMRFR